MKDPEAVQFFHSFLQTFSFYIHLAVISEVGHFHNETQNALIQMAPRKLFKNLLPIQFINLKYPN